nr:unnamed protein product [Callosobruchus chinensis]
MDTKYIITVVAITFLSKALAVAGDLEQIKQDHLNPANDEENTGTVRDHSKRTIFSPSHNAAWAKHVAVKPNGARHLIGYSPVDFRYTAVLKPVIRHQGYRYEKPKIQFHLKKPGGWKPVRPVGLPVNVPPPVSKPIHFDHFHPTGAGHLDVIHNRPVPHVDHIHPRPEHIHFDHIHQVPVQQFAIAAQPVAIRPQIPQHLPVPIVPQAIPAHSPVLHQPAHVLPQSPFFEVTKPDLGVLPFGAVFQTQVLREVPAPQLRPLLPAPALPIGPAAPPLPLPPAVPVAPPVPVHSKYFLHSSIPFSTTSTCSARCSGTTSSPCSTWTTWCSSTITPVSSRYHSRVPRGHQFCEPSE